MSNEHQFTFHQDPGHGWLQVHVQRVTDLQLDDLISHYSYMDCHPRDLHKGTHNVYLEEDNDMSLFMDAYQKAYDAYPQGIIERHYKNYAPIRNYPSYQSYFRHRLQLYIDYITAQRILNDGHVILKRLYDDFGRERVTNTLNHLLEEDTTS